MIVDTFEKAILQRGLTPIHLIMCKGRQVKWFVCLDNRPEKQYALIVYDSNGKAIVLPTYHEEITAETTFNIQQYEGGIKINGIVPQRAPSLDLHFPD